MRRLIWTAASLCMLGSTLALAQVVPKPTAPLPPEPQTTARPAASDDATAARRARGQAQDLLVEYTGELLDADNKPLSGVMGITFRLYEEEGSDTPIWSERLYVAVDLGVYTVILGKQTPFPRALSGQRRWLSVNL